MIIWTLIKGTILLFWSFLREIGKCFLIAFGVVIGFPISIFVVLTLFLLGVILSKGGDEKNSERLDDLACEILDWVCSLSNKII